MRSSLIPQEYKRPHGASFQAFQQVPKLEFIKGERRRPRLILLEELYSHRVKIRHQRQSLYSIVSPKIQSIKTVLHAKNFFWRFAVSEPEEHGHQLPSMPPKQQLLRYEHAAVSELHISLEENLHQK